MDLELESEVVNVDSVTACSSVACTDALTEDDFDHLTTGHWLNDKVFSGTIMSLAIFYRIPSVSRLFPPTSSCFSNPFWIL